MKTCTILHIEDDDADHVLFRRDLNRLDYDGRYIRQASFDGAKQFLASALKARDPLPGLIIADSKLGIYNGLDIVTWVKGHPDLREIPVVVYSSAISPTDSVAVIRAGAAACLTKPIADDETLVALQLILSYAQARCHDEDPSNTSMSA